MANDHFLELPKSSWILKIVQLVLAVLVLAFSAYCVSVVDASAHALALFTCLFTIIIVTYYLVAVHGAPQIYTWVALLTLECLAVVFWLSTWAVLAAWYAALLISNNDGFDYYTYYKRDVISFTKRDLVEEGDAYGALLITSMAFSVIEFIIYCVTLGYMGMAVHRHRKGGGPMAANTSATTPREQEKGNATEMSPPAGQPAPYTAPPPEQTNPAPYAQPMQQTVSPQEQQHQVPYPVHDNPPQQVPYPNQQNAYEVS